MKGFFQQPGGHLLAERLVAASWVKTHPDLLCPTSWFLGRAYKAWGSEPLLTQPPMVAGATLTAGKSA